jgi:SAM-dependent methyltransferase
VEALADRSIYRQCFLEALKAKNIDIVNWMIDICTDTFYIPIITDTNNEEIMVNFMEHIDAAGDAAGDAAMRLFNKIIRIYSDDGHAFLYSDYRYLYDMMRTCPYLCIKAFQLLPKLKWHCSDQFIQDTIRDHNTPVLVEFIQRYTIHEVDIRGNIYNEIDMHGSVYREIIRNMTNLISPNISGGYRDINDLLYIFKHLIISAEKNHKEELINIISSSLNFNTIASIRNGFLLFKKLKKYIDKKCFAHKDSSQFTPLCDAARYGTLNTFRYLEKYSQPACYFQNEYTDVLHLSTMNSDTRILEYIVKSQSIREIIGVDRENYVLDNIIYHANSYRKVTILCENLPKIKHELLSYMVSCKITPLYLCKKILRTWDFTLKLDIDSHYYFYNNNRNMDNPTIIELISTKHGSSYNLLYLALCKVFRTCDIIVPVILELLEKNKLIVIRTLFNGFMETGNEENYIRSIRYLKSKCIVDMPSVFDYSYDIKKQYRNYRIIEILFVNGIDILDKITFSNITGPTIRKCKLVKKTLLNYIKRRFSRLLDVHRDNFTQTTDIISRSKFPRMVFRKTVNPEHITPVNYLDFIISGGPYYISPKADGVPETIKLYDYYPKVNCVGLSGIQFKSEKVLMANGRYINLIYGDYATIKALQGLIAEYAVNGFSAFVAANKDPLWWPKYMAEFDPYTADMDAVKNEICVEYPIDGWILSSPNSDKILKMKPDCHLTIDLLHEGGKFYYDREHIEFEADGNGKVLADGLADGNGKGLADGKVYRCYHGKASWQPLEMRDDKLKPNNASIVNEILAYFKNKWTFAELRPYYSQLYYQESGVFPYKKSIEDITTYFHYFKTGGRTLDIGCGFKTRKYMAIIQTKDYIGVDIDYSLIQLVKKKDQVGNYYTMDWSRQEMDFFGQGPISGTFDNLLCINSMAAINGGNSINKLTRTGCIFIIRFLDNDLLQKILPDDASFIADKENFVRYYGAGRKRIKYYYSHCHTKPLIENIVNKDNIMTLLDHKWKIKKYSYAADVVGGTWENYLKCFSVLVLERLSI